VISNRVKRGCNPHSQALKSAANAMGNLKTNSHLARFFRKIAYKNDRKEAITATAHKLAVIIHQMPIKFQPYQPYSKPQTDQQAREKKLKDINKLIIQFNVGPGEVLFSPLITNPL